MELQVVNEFGEGPAAGRFVFFVINKKLEFPSATETRRGLLGTFPLLVVTLVHRITF